MTEARDLHVDELVGAYALDALDAPECALVEDHLGRCAACASSVERARGLAALLSVTAEQRAPRAGHELRFMARLAAEERPAHRPAEINTAVPARVRSSVRRLAPLAAAALLVLGFGAWNLRLQQELAQQQQLVRVFSEADARELAPSIAAGDAQGKAFLDRSTNQVLLTVNHLPELPVDRTYQLWFTRPDRRLESGGTFRVDQRGIGTILATAPAGLGAYIGVGVSSEPGDGSHVPSGPMIMYWDL